MDKKILCPRGSVGAVIRDTEGRFLVLYRKTFPQGLAFVAGHGEAGEDPKMSLKREVAEEAGISVKECALVLHETFENPCKNGFGSHEWWVFEITSWEGNPQVMEPDKHAFVRFMRPEEILRYAETGDIDPAWGKFILPTLSARYPQLTRNI